MTAVTVSPKYQIVIPKDVRDAVGLAIGQKVQLIAHGDRIELVPLRPITALKGSLPGIGTEVPRDLDRL